MGNVTGAGEFMLLTGPKVCIALALFFALFGGVIFKIRGGQLLVK